MKTSPPRPRAGQATRWGWSERSTYHNFDWRIIRYAPARTGRRLASIVPRSTPAPFRRERATWRLLCEKTG